MLDEITFDYDENIFDWSNSKLYYFLCDHYGLHDVLIELKSKGTILVEKYNVIGNREGNNYITVYNNIGELKPVCYIFLEDIKECKIKK